MTTKTTTDDLRSAASAIRTPHHWNASTRSNLASSLDRLARSIEEGTAVVLDLSDLEDPEKAADQVGIEASRLAKGFAFCSPENQPDAPAPIWATIRDLRKIAATIRTATGTAAIDAAVKS
jgi:hypothetical protein